MIRLPQLTPAFCGLLLACGWLQGNTVTAAGTDVVRLVGGDVLRGQVVRREADGGLLLAVRRAWLEETAPRRATAAATAEKQQSREAIEQLINRIDRMLAEPAGRYDEGLTAFLRRERRRATDLLAAAHPANHQFVWVGLPGAKVREVVPADADWRRLVQWGWHEDLPEVETLSQPKLTALLEARGIVTTDDPPRLADRLPPLPQNDREWQARIALLEDAYGPPVTFQGTGDIVVRTDGDLKIESILPVITQLIGGDLGELFTSPDEDRRQQDPADRWLAAARQQATTEGRFRATRVDVSPDRDVVVVESVFEVQLETDGWVTLWQDRVQLDASAPREVSVDRIAADPRVGQALEAIKSLGVFGDAALAQALRHGAATLEAKEMSDRHFDAFNSTYTVRLDGPPLVW